MPVALTFGSFGDIVSLVQLASSVIARFISTQGNLQQYSEVLLELHALLQSLEVLQHELQAPRTAGASSVSYDVRRDIEARIAACRVALEKMERGIIWYQVCLRERRPREWRELWRRAGYRLFAPEELERYKQEIQRQHASMNIALLMLTRQTQEATHSLVVAGRSVLHEVHATAESTRCDVKLVLKTVLEMGKPSPHFVGYPWEGGRGPHQRMILLRVPFGLEFWIPEEFCEDWQTVVRMMEAALEAPINSLREALIPDDASVFDIFDFHYTWSFDAVTRKDVFAFLHPGYLSDFSAGRRRTRRCGIEGERKHNGGFELSERPLESGTWNITQTDYFQMTMYCTFNKGIIDPSHAYFYWTDHGRELARIPTGGVMMDIILGCFPGTLDTLCDVRVHHTYRAYGPPKGPYDLYIAFPGVEKRLSKFGRVHEFGHYYWKNKIDIDN
ncbi:hypothetical protein GLOTRDRAFT_126178 [Gloeophyllum trabeum ATCC 11539]|uniref:Fungal N-terminal domain-containing protein n=1 Tax=Gloeophyllum trabeum (strain ATCC 11539 / FP-39264 / Madison 617) TaxID=670483 RepID=S7RY53_GLOTA|nr:uncharacterized protein GLOTRDRAFT_126178 [Gloeophyllum trabeum ATCC 11539]EPQ59885.1 hypothetical protein GLOTRDRAFT_126178 [Gloeophyllum trabeum ATCC 11539]